MRGVFCTAMADVPAAKDRTAVQTNRFGRNRMSERRMAFENRLSVNRSGNKRGNNCGKDRLRDGIARVFLILLHGGWANEAA